MTDKPMFTELDHSLTQFETSLIEADKTNKLINKAFCSDHIGMCTVSMDGKFERVNKACCKIWERSEGELLNTKFQDITHADDLQKDLYFIDQVVTGIKDHYSMAKRYLMPDGRYKPCWLEVSIIKDINGVFHIFFSKILSLEAITKIKSELDIWEKHGVV